MSLSKTTSKHNYRSFLFHAAFLAFAQNFMDIDTVIPSMIVEAGGNAVHIGIMTAIMFGGSSLTQLFFAPFLSNYSFKKKFLLLGINSRILSLLALAIILLYSYKITGVYIIWSVLLLLMIFSLGGAFSNISYTDILGKSIFQTSRKQFFSLKQVISGVILFISSLIARQILIANQYPNSYAYMYFIAFGALLIASMGFWIVKETVPSKMVVKSVSKFFMLVKNELHENPRLNYFLGFVNTMGVSLTLLPFIMLYAKENFFAQSAETGMFLLFKVVGGVIMGFILYMIAGRYKYRYLLYGNTLLVLLIPIIILFSISTPSFTTIFFIGGMIYIIYSISINGILLEISDNTNRALYIGIAGAGSIIPAIFPLIAGQIINHYGFSLFLILFMLIITSSIFFIYKMNCEK
ncbi:MFS transporter [Candidatus Neomarinimicrobiota bacterium]